MELFVIKTTNKIRPYICKIRAGMEYVYLPRAEFENAYVFNDVTFVDYLMQAGDRDLSGNMRINVTPNLEELSNF